METVEVNAYQSSEISELAKALINVQRNLQPAVRDATNPFVHNRYATLNSVMESCREALLSNNIWLTQYPVPADLGFLGLVTKLTHAESGQWQASLAMVPLPKADPQGMGSAMTYARRYALSAMLGIVTDDDDGESANAPATMSSRTGGKARAATRTAAASAMEASASHGKTNAIAPQNNSSSLVGANLPKIDGVTYQTVVSQDGRECIVARGETAAKKELLAGIGFKWNPNRRMWWMYADIA